MSSSFHPPISRRFFVKQGALAFASLGAGALLGPAFVRAAALSAEGRKSAGGRRTLVCVFQRGAADGLSMVVPYGDRDYYRLRGEIALAAPARAAGAAGVLDLDGHFGLHPALRGLHELYGAGELAVLHACGNPLASRSHFEAQDLMESGTGDDRHVATGWLNRMIGCCPEDQARRSALAAVALTGQMPRSLQGPEEALAIADLTRFKVGGVGVTAAGGMGGATRGFEQLYESAVGDALHSAGQEGFAAMDLLRKAVPADYRPAHGAQYPNGTFGRGMRQVAQLIKADVGLEVAFVEIGGWDTHANQGAAAGALANRLGELGAGLTALHRDLGSRMSEVLVLTMSEFGRTARQNGNRGTDHGHGTAFFALGGGVKGGRVLGRWPGLAPDRLFEGRDLAITTDYRDFFAEACVRHMGVPAAELAQVFPAHAAGAGKFPGYLG
ncbi:hypothetical protein Verru16b_00707 [Lacunisphaera limnophila]|uniref:DUF1501 domain-containing protein n=1 Tax=Lacunisphaera limnophila TaxID=1838286 RepID=A0A1D8ARX9_9BACT|nr:DUF1501 domain-containing protein [Lacunisphaera limnophila]AOS43655.1 hypothetical protein Verru16b_00707 [Lacunisphaera limnophila]